MTALMSVGSMPARDMSWPSQTPISSAVRLMLVDERHSPRIAPPSSKTAKTVLVLPVSMARSIARIRLQAVDGWFGRTSPALMRRTPPSPSTSERAGLVEAAKDAAHRLAAAADGDGPAEPVGARHPGRADGGEAGIGPAPQPVVETLAERSRGRLKRDRGGARAGQRCRGIDDLARRRVGSDIDADADDDPVQAQPSAVDRQFQQDARNFAAADKNVIRPLAADRRVIGQIAPRPRRRRRRRRRR